MSIGKLIHVDEPNLTFGFNQKTIDPRDGITLFGPFTREKLIGQVNIGIIGSQKLRQRLIEYFGEIQKPVFGIETELARPYFPGLEASFNIFINFNNIVEIEVPQNEIDQFLHYTDSHQRVHNLVNLYSDRLIKYVREEEVPILVWFVIIPDTIYLYGRPKSRIPKSDRNIKVGLKKNEQRSKQDFLFYEFNQLREAYQYEVNFHNQLKAKLLKYKIVTQIICESTIAYKKIWTNERLVQEEEKFDTAKAWNITTTLYYKAGGLPWILGDVREKVCYLGIVFKKLESSEISRNACCAAQMFLNSGDGMVFRGNVGPWYNPETKEFHLSAEDAFKLLSKSLEAFKNKSENNNYPDEIFIHARTYFDDEEWKGFSEAAEGKSRIVGIRIRDDRVFKMYRDFTFPIPRGSTLILDDQKAFLWTKGFIPRIQTVMGLETPNPLSIEITHGEASIETVCKDILALTKLNYNACIYGDGSPVTLRFADSIGEVLTAGPEPETEILPFKHYV